LSFVTVAKEEENPPRGSVGRAFSGVEIAILDEESKHLGANQSGQIFVRSPLVFEGYAGSAAEPDITRATISTRKLDTGSRREKTLDQKSGDFLSVGDIGCLDENGFLFLTGRKDRMIVVAGKNLFPEEVEAVLQDHPGIAAAAVITVPDDKRGSRIAAVVQIVPDWKLAPADIIAGVRRRLPLYKIPRRYYRIADWPQTRSGKTDFARIQALFAAGKCEQLA
jgi:long-chain acyl-CoA synthetase